jgi:hypothetical protein
VLPAMHLERNNPVENGKELSPALNKLYVECFDEILKKVEQKKGR